jgi:hypothetical protein
LRLTICVTWQILAYVEHLERLRNARSNTQQSSKPPLDIAQILHPRSIHKRDGILVKDLLRIAAKIAGARETRDLTRTRSGAKTQFPHPFPRLFLFLDLSPLTN